MIADRTNLVSVESNLTGDKIDMGIDQEATNHIMALLTDLYSDPEFATLRELSTNAFDAHVEAGNPDPIKITLPSALHPFLTIRDRGIGLSHEDIQNIYSKYGASTKRETNDQTGMFGLGCKAPLTYAQQFTLTGIKDGQRIEVVISREEDGGGSMTVIDSGETDDPNGVEIVVPAKRENELERKAREFFAYWPEGSVLVNGEAPEHVDGLWLTETLCLVQTEDRYERNHRVVMGNVPYPAEINVDLPYGSSLIAFVDTGACHIPPQRESLMYTDKTKATIVGIETTFNLARVGAIQAAIDEAETPQEALRAKLKWCNALKEDSHTLTYNGTPLPDDYTLPKDKDGHSESIEVVPAVSSVLSRTTKYRALAPEFWPDAVWFFGYDGAKFSAAKKKKIMHWAGEKGITAKHYVLLANRPKRIESWLDADKIVDWAEIKAVKLPRNAPSHGTSRIPGSYDMYVDGISLEGEPASEIDLTNPVYWFNGNLMQGRKFNTWLISQDEDAKYTLVCLPANRIEKFQRDFPKATPIGDHVRAEYAAWRDALPRETQYCLSLNDHEHYDLRALRMLDEGRVDDPGLARAIRIAKTDLTNVIESRRMFSPLLQVASPRPTDWKNPLEKYPLVPGSYYERKNEDHIYIYVNAVYAAQQEGASSQ